MFEKRVEVFRHAKPGTGCLSPVLRVRKLCAAGVAFRLLDRVVSSFERLGHLGHFPAQRPAVIDAGGIIHGSGAGAGIPEHGAAVDPAAAGADVDAMGGKQIVDGAEHRLLSAIAGSAHHNTSAYFILEEGGVVDAQLPGRAEAAVKLCQLGSDVHIVDRTADDDAVRLEELIIQFVHIIVEHRAAVRVVPQALVAVDAGGDFPAEELYQFHLDPIDALSSLHRSHQTGVGGGTRLWAGTAANQQKLDFVHPNSLPFLFSVCQKAKVIIRAYDKV